MSFRTKSILGAVAAAVVVVSLASPADAARRGRVNPGAAIAAGVIGAAAGAIVAGAARPGYYAPDPYYNGPAGYYEPTYGYPAPVYAYPEPGYAYDEPYYRPNRVDGNYWQQRQRDERDRLGY